MKLSITKHNWNVAVSYLPLHSQSWEQLRATVVCDPERRAEAWRFMLTRSGHASQVGGTYHGRPIYGN